MASTIRDIAEAAKVSSSTVSLVLNRRPGVGMETRRRVIAIAERLNYKSLPSEPYPTAKNRTIRFLCIAKHGHINPNHNVFISDYIDGLENVAKSNGWTLEVSTYEHFAPDEIFRAVERADAAGVVVLGTELDEADVAAFESAPMPVVFIDTYHASAGFDFVDMNNDSSVFAAVSYLLDLGHQEIGLVKGAIETRNFRLRERSFAEALEHYGLAYEQQNVFAIDSAYEKGCEDMDALLKSRHSLPTALFCVADVVAYGCMKALRRNGLAIPDDISVVGFDDLPPSGFVDPPLTSIKVSKRRIGQRAMQLMLRRISAPHTPCEYVLIGGELVVRSSARRME